MLDVNISVIKLILSVVGFMGVGYFWYGPLFGKQWRHLTKIHDDKISKKEMQTSMAYSVLVAIIMNFVYQHIVQMSLFSFGGGEFAASLKTGFWVWLGFIVTVVLMNNTYERKPKKLTYINSGYLLVVMVVFAIVNSLF